MDHLINVLTHNGIRWLHDVKSDCIHLHCVAYHVIRPCDTTISIPKRVLRVILSIELVTCCWQLADIETQPQ
jgi:hypothetical protein